MIRANLAYGFLLLIALLIVIPYWIFEQIDYRLARCWPDKISDTHVWHRHTLLRWQWLAVHSTEPKYRWFARVRKP